jgi:predicted small lipoprotein YifL
MATGRWLVAASLLVCLTACGSPAPTVINPTATASVDQSAQPTVPTSTPTPTDLPPEVVLQQTCTLLADVSRSPSVQLVDYLLQVSVTARDNAEARQLIKRMRAIAARTPLPLREWIERFADESEKIVRTRRTPGLTVPYDPAPIQRTGNRIVQLCRDHV